MTKILLATWNINSVRARLPVILKWLKINNPDVVLLQELKAKDTDVPKEEIETLQTMIKNEMENAFSLDVPLMVDIGIGSNWLEAH